MKIRVVEVTGTPEELREAKDLIGLLPDSAGSRPSPAATADEAGAGADQPPWWSAVPVDLREHIVNLSPSAESQRHVMRFVGEVLRWGGVEAVRGRSSKWPDGRTRYVMLRNTGPRQYGAFVYVKPTNAGTEFRLTRSDVEPNEFVVFRDVRPDHPYQVKCLLHSDEAVDEALKLARMALDGVTGV
jgi:hypothetical protein